ncbi:MAG TPA: type III pantothenate kinase [Eoetvoesiella sp.]
MILLIDAGNTRVKFGWLRKDTGERETAALALHHNTLDQLNNWLLQLHAIPTAAIGVNVAGAAVAAAIEACLASHSCPVSWISSQQHALGVHNAYDTPAQLGPDRWVAMLGLAKKHPGNAIILASFGTATTIDTLSPAIGAGQRTFRGGLIFPGPALMRSSLARGTANLPEANGDTAAYPTHTHQAITTGIAAAQAGAVVRQWMIGLDQFDQPPHLYSAGGGWPVVKDEAQRLIAAFQIRMNLPATPIEWLPTPVLDGLAALLAQS